MGAGSIARRSCSLWKPPRRSHASRPDATCRRHAVGRAGRDLEPVVRVHARGGATARPGLDRRAACPDRWNGARSMAGVDASRIEAARALARVLVIGAVNSALPFFLFAYAALSLPASYLAILNATVP